MKNALKYILIVLVGSTFLYFFLCLINNNFKQESINTSAPSTKSEDSSFDDINNDITNIDNSDNNIYEDSNLPNPDNVDDGKTDTDLKSENVESQTTNKINSNTSTDNKSHRQNISIEDKIVDVKAKSYYALTPNYTFDFPFTVIKEKSDGTRYASTKNDCIFESSNSSVVSISNNRIVTHSLTPENNININYTCGSFKGKIEVRVTSLIHDKNSKKNLISPSLSSFENKKFIGCSLRNDYYPTDSIISSVNLSNKQIRLLNQILENKVKSAGLGTRAGIVEAARFLSINFPYKIPYTYGDWERKDVEIDNNRMNSFIKYNTNLNDAYAIPSSNKLIFGKYFEKGINVYNKSVFPTYEKNYVGGSNYGNGYKVELLSNKDSVNYSWGCQVGKEDQNNCTDNINGTTCGFKQFDVNNPVYYLNGFDCTGFIYWAFINGGFVPTRTSNKPYDINSLSFVTQNGSNWSDKTDAINISNTTDYSNRVMPGDLVYNKKSGELHIGMIIGIDETYLYIAEATGYQVRNASTSQLKRAGLIVSRQCKNTNKCPNGGDNGRFTTILLMDKVYPKYIGNLSYMWES